MDAYPTGAGLDDARGVCTMSENHALAKLCHFFAHAGKMSPHPHCQLARLEWVAALFSVLYRALEDGNLATALTAGAYRDSAARELHNALLAVERCFYPEELLAVQGQQFRASDSAVDLVIGPPHSWRSLKMAVHGCLAIAEQARIANDKGEWRGFETLVGPLHRVLETLGLEIKAYRLWLEGNGEQPSILASPGKVSVDEIDLVILLALHQSSPRRLTNNQIEATIGRRRLSPMVASRTIGKRAKILRQRGLIGYPHGLKRGATITPEGQRILEATGR